MVGESLTPELIIDFACAFGTFADTGRVLVGRDTRGSSQTLQCAVVAGLLSTGCEVLDFGICPTPILQHSVPRYAAAGAISISGGHTRMGYNALTLIGSDGAYMDPVAGEAVLDIFHARDFRRAAWNGMGTVKPVSDVAEGYFDALEAHVDAPAIRQAGLTVVVDPVNGAGCRYLKPFAERLGLRLVAINDNESAYLAHDPEPRPRNARHVASLIGHVEGDIGFVCSSDMGRLSLVCEDGEMASEEFTFPLIADHVLAQKKGVVATNCCTTRMADDVAKRHGVPIVKTPVGQAYILSALASENGLIGGEGNGSVTVTEFSRAFDGFLMMGLVMEAMVHRGKRVSELLRQLPRYHIVKRHVQARADKCYHALDHMREDERWRQGGTLDMTDGIRVDWEDGWIHVRASQTEPLIRVTSESTSTEIAWARALEAVRRLEERV